VLDAEFLTLIFFNTKNPKKSNFPKKCARNISLKNTKHIVEKHFSVKKSAQKSFKKYVLKSLALKNISVKQF